MYKFYNFETIFTFRRSQNNNNKEVKDSMLSEKSCNNDEFHCYKYYNRGCLKIIKAYPWRINRPSYTWKANDYIRNTIFYIHLVFLHYSTLLRCLDINEQLFPFLLPQSLRLHVIKVPWHDSMTEHDEGEQEQVIYLLYFSRYSFRF